MEESAGAVWLPIKAKAALSNAWLLRDFMPYETIHDRSLIFIAGTMKNSADR